MKRKCHKITSDKVLPALVDMPATLPCLEAVPAPVTPKQTTEPAAEQAKMNFNDAKELPPPPGAGTPGQAASST